MKTKILILSLLCMQFVFAQEITGSWSGELNVQGMQLPLIIPYKKRGIKSNYRWIVLNRATNIPIATTTFIDNQLV
jgi:hypothetical protein